MWGKGINLCVCVGKRRGRWKKKFVGKSNQGIGKIWVLQETKGNELMGDIIKRRDVFKDIIDKSEKDILCDGQLRRQDGDFERNIFTSNWKKKRISTTRTKRRKKMV